MSAGEAGACPSRVISLLRKCLLRSSVALVALSLHLAARADPITDLFNTGVDDNGVRLNFHYSTDPHYLATYNGGPGNLVEVRTNTVIPGGGNSEPVRWTNFAGNPWEAVTNFTVNSAEPAIAVITGRIYSDLDGTIYLNGAPVAPITGGGSWTSFAISAVALLGSNSIGFAIETATSAEEYLDVEMTGTFQQVPEPAMWLTLISAAFWLVLSVREKPRRQAVNG